MWIDGLSGLQQVGSESGTVLTRRCRIVRYLTMEIRIYEDIVVTLKGERCQVLQVEIS